MTRDIALERNTDPTGKVWAPAKVNSEQGLWMAAVIKDGKPTKASGLPDYLDGKFTNADKVQAEIKRHLTALWDMNDEMVRKNSRRSVSATES